MVRRNYNGQQIANRLKDLKKGDTVYVTFWGGKYIPAKVARVRTVECATIITIEKSEKISMRRFVGYHTDRKACSDNEYILTLDTYWGDKIQESLKSANERSRVIIKRADALSAMKTLKDWLFCKEEEYSDTEVE